MEKQTGGNGKIPGSVPASQVGGVYSGVEEGAAEKQAGGSGQHRRVVRTDTPEEVREMEDKIKGHLPTQMANAIYEANRLTGFITTLLMLAGDSSETSATSEDMYRVLMDLEEKSQSGVDALHRVNDLDPEIADALNEAKELHSLINSMIGMLGHGTGSDADVTSDDIKNILIVLRERADLVRNNLPNAPTWVS